MKILTAPRDPNPYQDLLHTALGQVDVAPRYLLGPTGSHTVNLLVSPLMLAWWRIRGYGVLHLHWVFGFSLPWARNNRLARQVMQRAFTIYLWTAKVLNVRLVYTAHDVMPHQQVFENDEEALRQLVRRCDAIIVHSSQTAEDLRRYGARDIHVIPQGTYSGVYPSMLGRETARRKLGLEDGDFVVVFFGKVAPYKGVDLLLGAIPRLADIPSLQVLVAGECADAEHRRLLESLAEAAGERVLLRLEWIPDEEVQLFLTAANVMALPFREVTNSSSVALAQAFGLPVIIPDLPQLASIPKGTAIRYAGGGDGLANAVREAAQLNAAERQAMGEKARIAGTSQSWVAVAISTRAVYEQVLSRSTEGGGRP